MNDLRVEVDPICNSSPQITWPLLLVYSGALSGASVPHKLALCLERPYKALQQPEYEAIGVKSQRSAQLDLQPSCS